MGLPVSSFADELRSSPAAAAPAVSTQDPAVPELDRAGLELGSDSRDHRFAALAERHARFMFRVAYGLLRNAPDAEDAVQEALLKLYRGGGWIGMDDEKAFLARTVWRVGLDVAARRPKGAQAMEDVAECDLAASGSSPEQAAAESAERALLRRLIDALPEELRQPLVLSAIEEMTSREVAIAIGIPEGTVRTRLMRARTELKRRFEAGRLQRQHTQDHLHVRQDAKGPRQ